MSDGFFLFGAFQDSEFQKTVFGTVLESRSANLDAHDALSSVPDTGSFCTPDAIAADRFRCFVSWQG